MHTKNNANKNPISSFSKQDKKLLVDFYGLLLKWQIEETKKETNRHNEPIKQDITNKT